MVLFLLRGAFILLAACVSFLYILSFQQATIVEDTRIGLGFGGVILMVVAASAVVGAVIALDMFIREKKLSAVSGIFLGLIAGLLAAYALGKMVDLGELLFVPEAGPDKAAFSNLFQGLRVFIGLVTCYLGISLVLQTKDDFRFVIPYVEFARQIRGNRPTILDTSTIIDGRIADVIETQILQGQLLVPRFVLNELQGIADSSDRLRRSRGRRGLEVLQKLQDSDLVDVSIDDAHAEGATVDQQLVALAETSRGRIMTNDYNLNKVARLRGVDVVNINDLAKALRPVVLPGERMTVRLIRAGESPAQAVGYLDDGTMVVVEHASHLIGQPAELEVTSTLQTSAGRMIFGRPLADQVRRAPDGPGRPVPDADRPAGAPPGPEAHTGGDRASGRNPRRRPH